MVRSSTAATTDVETRITAWIESAIAGSGRVGLITGPRGAGKSVLGLRALTLAQRLDCLTAAVEGPAVRSGDLMETLAEQFPSPAGLREADGLDLRRRIRDATAGGRAVCVLVDGFDELDPVNIRALEGLMQVPPARQMLFIVTTTASGTHASARAASAALMRLEAAGELDTVLLKPIDSGEATALIEASFHPQIVSSRFVQQVIAMSGGNRHWIDVLTHEVSALPESVQSALLGGSMLLEEMPVSPTVQRLVRARLVEAADALPVLEALSVWQTSATLETLALLMEQPLADVERNVEQLERSRLLCASGRMPTITFDFTEPVLGWGLRSVLPRSTFLRLQRAAAKLTQADRVDIDAGALRRRAIRYLDAREQLHAREREAILRAARAELERSRFHTAGGILERLLGRTRAEDPIATQAQVLLAETYARSGSEQRAKRLLRHVDDGQPSPTRAEIRRARDLVAAGRDRDALAVYDGLLTRDDIPRVERAQLLADSAHIASALGWPDEAALRREAAAREADAAHETGFAASIRILATSSRTLRAEPNSIALLVQELATVRSQAVRQTERRGMLARAVSDIAFSITDSHGLGRAIGWWRRAHRLAERHEDHAAISSIAFYLSLAEIEHGEWDRAERTIGKALLIDESLHRTRALRGSQAVRNLLGALRGTPAVPTPSLDRAFRGSPRFGGPIVATVDLVAQFERRLQQGDLLGAGEIACIARDELRALPGFERLLLVEVTPRVALVAARTGDQTRLEETIGVLEAHIAERAYTIPIIEPIARQLRAYRARLAGERRLEAELAMDAGAGFAQIGYLRRAAFQLYEAGEASVAAGYPEEARAPYEQALEWFTSMGATEARAKTQERLQEIGVRKRPRSALGSPLTPRQWDVAGLAAHGLTDDEIAAALGISRRTASTHMHNVLRSIGLRSRRQLAEWVPLHQRERVQVLLQGEHAEASLH